MSRWWSRDEKPHDEQWGAGRYPELCEAGEGEAETPATAHCGLGGGLVSTDLLVCGLMC